MRKSLPKAIHPLHGPSDNARQGRRLWKQENGEMVRLRDMTYWHLKNTIRLLEEHIKTFEMLEAVDAPFDMEDEPAYNYEQELEVLYDWLGDIRAEFARRPVPAKIDFSELKKGIK